MTKRTSCLVVEEQYNKNRFFEIPRKSLDALTTEVRKSKTRCKAYGKWSISGKCSTSGKGSTKS